MENNNSISKFFWFVVAGYILTFILIVGGFVDKEQTNQVILLDFVAGVGILVLFAIEKSQS